MNMKQFYDALKKSQEKQGAFFNKDKDLVFELLESLQLNREKYGYMACPCRLACGDREHDKDIICPCDYRKADMEEYGACFCGLYVSEKVNNLEMVPEYVPERRPAEKII